MKAAQINEYGGTDVLKTNDNVPKPSAGEGQVLVEVRAASANPIDWKVREGYLKEMVPLTFPATLGGDVSGVVSELGAGVDAFRIGDEVYGLANTLSGTGSFAEFTPVAVTSLAPKPKNLSFEEAAAVPLAATSAYQALTDEIGLKSGQKILIHGGAGGIGSLAVQIAKHFGAYVAATVSAKDLEFVKSLGADEVIDYKSQDFTQIIRDYDAVFDTTGGGVAEKSLTVLKKGGTLVSMADKVDEQLAKDTGVTAISLMTQVTTERLTAISKMIDEGAFTVQIDKVFPLDEAGKALGYIQESHHGKSVIKVKGA